MALSSCASSDYRSRDWSAYEGPGAAHFQAEEIVFPHVDDPLERVNRVTSLFNYWLLDWVVSPTTRVYRFFLPELVRTRLERASENLLFPVRFANNLLQGKLEETGVETSRFAVNSTVGLLGLFDPAAEWGLHPYPEDFGQTFAKWGWRDSTYLVLPVLGPSTVRDAFGLVPDTLVDPATYFFPATYVREFNALSNAVEDNLRLIRSTYDAYEAVRTLSILQREVDVDDFEWHASESGPAQTLGAIFLVPEDEDFGGEAEVRRIRLAATGKELPYSLWLQPEPAPLMYVLPGFGGHRLGASVLALAEIGYRSGHSVVALSSPTNWEFMRSGASVTVPGFGPVDAYDAHVALTEIDRELAALHPGRMGKRRLMGLSIGAYEALLIAAGADRPLEGERQDELLEFDQFIALDPPVDLEHALQQLDRFYNAPLAFPADERAARVEEIFAKVLYLSHGDLEPGIPLPFTDLEARFLIGLAFRLDLQFLLLQSQELEDSGVLLTKRSRLHMAPAFREAAEYSYSEYFYAFVLPYVAARESDVAVTEEGARTLFERTSLRGSERGLAGDDRIRIFANANDFLLRAEDVEWLETTIGDRLTLFSEGGHLGNLYLEYVQQVIGETLEEEAP
ncbi:MAG: VacJ family lipoprotein [Planctomycetota bacterium]